MRIGKGDCILIEASMYIYILFLSDQIETFTSSQGSHISLYLLDFEFIFIITKTVPFLIILDHYENEMKGPSSSSRLLRYFKYYSRKHKLVLGERKSECDGNSIKR